jgi:hypothetical protein
MTNTKKWPIRLLTFFLGGSLSMIALSSSAQIDSTAKKVGDKTASVAVKGASTVADKVYKGKEGPHGEKVFINKNDHKYYVDNKGHKVYLKSWQIKDKKES